MKKLIEEIDEMIASLNQYKAFYEAYTKLNNLVMEAGDIMSGANELSSSELGMRHLPEVDAITQSEKYKTRLKEIISEGTKLRAVIYQCNFWDLGGSTFDPEEDYCLMARKYENVTACVKLMEEVTKLFENKQVYTVMGAFNNINQDFKPGQ